MLLQFDEMSMRQFKIVGDNDEHSIKLKKMESAMEELLRNTTEINRDMYKYKDETSFKV